MNSQLRDSQITLTSIILSMWFRVGQMKYTSSDRSPIKVACVYLRVSTDCPARAPSDLLNDMSGENQEK